MKTISGFLLLICSLLLVSCDSDPVTGQGQDCHDGYVDFGQGVYYFCEVGEDFGRALSEFKRSHPLFIVTSIAPENRTDTGSHGEAVGYWVNIELIEQRQQNQ